MGSGVLIWVPIFAFKNLYLRTPEKTGKGKLLGEDFDQV